MRDFFQEQLNELKRELTIMGSNCEEIIALASRALTDMDHPPRPLFGVISQSYLKCYLWGNSPYFTLNKT